MSVRTSGIWISGAIRRFGPAMLRVSGAAVIALGSLPALSLLQAQPTGPAACALTSLKQVPNTNPATSVSNWAKHLVEVHKSGGGFKRSAARMSTGGNAEIEFTPHAALCAASLHGPKNRGQIIGMIRNTSDTRNADFQLESGETAYVVMQRLAQGYGTVTVYGLDGLVRHHAMNYRWCHRVKHASHAGLLFDWGSQGTTCDVSYPPQINPLWSARPAPPGHVRAFWDMDPAWFACDEGCCHIT
jgi:hypothetical protein